MINNIHYHLSVVLFLPHHSPLETLDAHEKEGKGREGGSSNCDAKLVNYDIFVFRRDEAQTVQNHPIVVVDLVVVVVVVVIVFVVVVVVSRREQSHILWNPGMSGELLVDPRSEKLDIGKDGRSSLARTFAPGNDANHLESAGIVLLGTDERASTITHAAAVTAVLLHSEAKHSFSNQVRPRDHLVSNFPVPSRAAVFFPPNFPADI